MNVTYVDSSDNIIGSGSIANAISNGIVVRIARVFLRNSKGQLLLQRRADKMTAQPGKWDQTAGGHVDEGEDYKVAANRELYEEMGISGVELSEIATFYSEESGYSIIKKRFNKIFSGVYDGDVQIDNDEVSDYKWVSITELAEDITQNPNDYPDGFITAFNIYQDIQV